MKKGKIFLTATLVVVVAGGALAFKAKKNGNQDIFYCENAICVLSGFSTEAGGTSTNLPLGTSYYINGMAGADCSPTVACGIKLANGTMVYNAK